MNLVISCLVVILLCVSVAACAADKPPAVRIIPGQAELGTVEIHGVGAGEFQPDLWESGRLNVLPDYRSPMLRPRLRGVFRNIYAPSAVETKDGWRLFYGAWDGVGTPNDRIYSVLTKDFLDFTDRQIVIEHGEFVHCCNVNALLLPDGSWRMMCTVYPDKKNLNKPAMFSSANGFRWNGARPPYPAKQKDIVAIDGYDRYADGDLNGMNAMLYEDGLFRLYFNNFKDWGRVYRATSKDCRHFTFDGVALEFGAVVNDVKKLSAGGKPYYIMGLHMNGDKLWCSLSEDGMKFTAPRELARNLDDADRYICSFGWVVCGNRLLGFLYGAGPVPTVDRNRIFARWLQKKVVFTANDGTRYEPIASLGPDRQILNAPKDKNVEGYFTVYGEDGSTVVIEKCPGTLISGAVYVIEGLK